MSTRWWEKLAGGALLVVGMALAGCTGTPTADAGASSSSSSGGETGCRRAQDCGGGFQCVIPDGGTRGECVKTICTANSDCTPPAECNMRSGLCLIPRCNPAEPFTCPAGKVCRNRSDPTTGQVLSSCDDPGAPAAECSLDVAKFSLRTGETRMLDATGYTSAGAVEPYASFAYASSAAGTATVDSNGVVEGVAAGTATITVTPQPSGTACTATVAVYAAVVAADARAVVIDNRSGEPLSGVHVQLRKTDDTVTVVQTDATGAAAFPAGGPAADIKDITAFPANHAWVTYVAPGTNDVGFFVDPIIDTTKVAGAGGTFDTSLAQPPTGDIKLGLAAFSIAGALSDINLMGLVGRTVPTDINIESIGVQQEDVPLPSGVFLKLGQEDIKGSIDMYVDGPCTTAAPCRRVLWGLGGQVALAKIGPIISEVAGGGTEDVDAGKILAAVLPFFKKFYHFVGKQSYELTDMAAPTGDASPAWPSELNNVVVKPNFILSQAAVWTVPSLPALPTDASKSVSGALVLTGSLVPGQGMVPLGVTAGLDECPEATTSTCKLSGTADRTISCADDNATSNIDECDGLAAGDVALDYAPPHDGLEGTKFVTVAVALDVNSLGAGALFTSVLVSFNDTIAGIDSNTKNTFPARGATAAAFLAFNQGSWTPSTRTYAGTSRVAGADFYRLNLDTSDKTWLVFFSAAADAFSVEVPPVPTGVTGDRIANVDVQAFRLLESAGITTLTAMAEFNSTNFDNLVNYTGGFSTQECAAIYPARACTANAECAAGFDDNYTCDSTAGVCVNVDANVTAAGAGDCPAGARKLFVSGTTGPAICSQIPACEIQ